MSTESSSTTTVLNTDSQHDMSAQATHIELFFRGRQYAIERQDLPFKIGRDPQSCDLVINNDLVSRNHCTIEFRGRQIGLLDRSTNGTCVQVGRTDGLFIRDNFYPLAGQGYIKLGENIDLADPDLILFKVLFKPQ
ncbi:FHA domain-containing protein [Exilibacterium tricleocarpae]|uniref:FHA domain-containing protein n=1 Tax=Exilibacterium tricleocarpae TaxID=2591008 RepID=A0A545TLV9_9GAMM|nr:FHA domain-containing protein [Exilibacterium tricleocarpae]TQV78209.1 FHA domain-containing protein [Exilibacterium tricleocarpae]